MIMEYSLSTSEQKYLALVIQDWSISHGLAISTQLPTSDEQKKFASAVPVTVFPSLFPRMCFERAQAIQRYFNELYAYISCDENFLQEIVKDILETDEFIANLWSVHLKAKNEGYTQILSLGLFRSDYMVDKQSNDSQPTIKQVEFNTIASSFGGLSSKTSQLHRYLALNEYLYLRNYVPIDPIKDHLPENESTNRLAQGLQVAFNEYIKVSHQIQYDSCIIFLVQNFESNIYDQLHLEYELKELGIPTFRLLFTEVFKHTRLNSSHKRELLYCLPTTYPSKTFQVAVVYFRAGYGPSDYEDKSAWDARLHIEKSNAIKCPSVLTQLAGIKKVQQVLATSSSSSSFSSSTITSFSILRSFLSISDLEDISKLGETFTDIYPLDDSVAGREAQKIATDSELCKDYVLKPQREGGGNNIYRSEIPIFLTSQPKNQWKSYILMKIISPPNSQNYLLRNGVIQKSGIACELGIYGTCLWNQNTKRILHNEQAGYLLRTKSDQSEEGGVVAGYGHIDSCNLV